MTPFREGGLIQKNLSKNRFRLGSAVDLSHGEMDIEMVIHQFLIDSSVTSGMIFEAIVRPVAKFLELEDEVDMERSMGVADRPEHHAFPSFVTYRVTGRGVQDQFIERPCVSPGAFVPHYPIAQSGSPLINLRSVLVMSSQLSFQFGHGFRDDGLMVFVTVGPQRVHLHSVCNQQSQCKLTPAAFGYLSASYILLTLTAEEPCSGGHHAVLGRSKASYKIYRSIRATFSSLFRGSI